LNEPSQPHDDQFSERGASGSGSPEHLEALVKTALREFPRFRSALAKEGFALFKKKPGHRYVPKVSRKLVNKLRTPLEDGHFMALAMEVVKPGRTSLDYGRLYTLYEAFRNVIAAAPEDEPIELLEVGVYRGGSSYFLASAARRFAPNRVRLVAVDTFEGHSARDLPEGSEGPHRPSVFGDAAYEEVCEYLSQFEFVEVVKGRVQEVAAAIATRPVHLAHVDVDIYAPTLFTLELLEERMARGGVIVVDDYDFKTCPGVRKAVDEFTSRKGKSFFKLALGNGQCCLVLTH
jgi:macrocin-O-methyltransferase TylF-like protien